MSGGIIFGHAVLTNARNKKANLVISLGLSVRNLSGHGEWGPRVQQFVWMSRKAVVLQEVEDAFFDTCGSCSIVKMWAGETVYCFLKLFHFYLIQNGLSCT